MYVKFGCGYLLRCLVDCFDCVRWMNYCLKKKLIIDYYIYIKYRTLKIKFREIILLFLKYINSDRLI